MSPHLAADLEQAFGLSPLELARIVTLEEAVRLSSLSEDTWRREHPEKLVRLSDRRVGVRLRDALMLPTETCASADSS